MQDDDDDGDDDDDDDDGDNDGDDDDNGEDDDAHTRTYILGVENGHAQDVASLKACKVTSTLWHRL